MLLLEPGACEAIDPDALQARADHYARREEASAETLGEERPLLLPFTSAGASQLVYEAALRCQRFHRGYSTMAWL